MDVERYSEKRGSALFVDLQNPHRFEPPGPTGGVDAHRDSDEDGEGYGECEHSPRQIEGSAGEPFDGQKDRRTYRLFIAFSP